MQTTNYEGLQISDGQPKKVTDALVVEAALQININGEPYTVVMRTPGDDFELIRGLLYAEDIYKEVANPLMEVVESKENGFAIINVQIAEKKIGKGYMNKRTLLSVSSCGICGKQRLEDISFSGKKLEKQLPFDTTMLEAMFEEMKLQQVTFERSGGSHAAALFDKNYHLIDLKEDIGRHNAVDKVVGELLSVNELPNARTMLVSGRVSYEIISKAFIAKIQFVIAVSACSTLAVDFAKEFGVCLIGFSRGKKATIYVKA